MKLNKAIQNRWSPIDFSEQVVSQEMIDLLFEAARLAPSSRNEQPWNYYYVQRENKKVFNDLLNILTGNNPTWAQHAQVLIISVMKKIFDYKDRPNGKALHDIGAANVSIAIQAAEMGLQIHQMGGFNKDEAADYLKLDKNIFEPVTVIAVGFPEETLTPTEKTKQRIAQHQSRKELKEFVFRIGNE